MEQKPPDAVGEFSRSVATPPVIGKMDLQSGGRTGLPGRHLWEQTANSEFANSVRRFLIHSLASAIATSPAYAPWSGANRLAPGGIRKGARGRPGGGSSSGLNTNADDLAPVTG